MQAIGLGVVWPATVAAVAACSYYTLKYEVAINHFIATDFATSIILSLITTVGASLVRASISVELWHPRFVTGVGCDMNILQRTHALGPASSVAHVLHRLHWAIKR
jgi:hypothetical protein